LIAKGETGVELELDDIQGNILFGYAKLPAAQFVLLSIEDSVMARPWIARLADAVANGKERPTVDAINIAFTFDGFKTLDLNKQGLNTFSQEFVEGMTTNHKQRLLGDFDQNDPEKWHWGGSKTPTVHAVLMLYAKDDVTLAELYTRLKPDFTASGLSEIQSLPTVHLKFDKEHFGFRDGISEPVIEGTERYKLKHPPGFNTIKPGEFVLGYLNEYDLYTSSPTVPTTDDVHSLLKPPSAGGAGLDFGRNGTYVVFRQLEQDVQGFWKYCDSNASGADGKSDPAERTRLAAKMVGRWPSGTPFSESPDSDPLPSLDFNDKALPGNGFLFAEDDAHGYKCPIGSHIRRSFPRDTIGPDKKQSIEVSKRHRIIRRGREYGAPIDPEMRPDEMLSAPAPAEPRGLYFICINADIGRQFEFIQDTWLNDQHFQGLYSDPDPIAAGVTAVPNQTVVNLTFTVQSCPVRQKLPNLPNFITTRGGAYFFLPGINALRYIGSQK